jgi:hypothetical protein
MPHSADDLATLQARTRYVEPSGCWHWTGPLTSKGYPSLELNGRQVLAVRASYVAQNGPIPPGSRPIQSCSDPLCICPFHLKLVAESFRRPPRAGVNGGVRIRKLTNDQVRQIRASTENENILAERFKITRSHVLDIRSGRRKAAVL